MTKKLFLSILILVVLCLTGCKINTTNNTHSHTYLENWAYDNTYHWHQASCEHDTLSIDKAQHNFDEGTIIDPTYEEEGYIIYSCTICNYQQQEKIEMLEHSYSSDYSYNDEYHWHSCIDEGYENLKINEEKHTDSNEVVLKQSTDTETGLAQYTCSLCNHIYQKILLIRSTITSLPTVENRTIYAGELLESVKLSGGSASVDGYFVWTDPEEKITGSKEYSVSFIPNDHERYAVIESSVYLDVTQLTITVETSDNGSCNYEGIINVDYNSDFKIDFIPDSGYGVGSIVVDGSEVSIVQSYVFNDITSNHTLYVSFEETTDQSNLTFQIEYIEGTANAYTISGNTIMFNNINSDSVYSISGVLDGNIIIDIGDDYKLDLELTGFTLSSSTINPIVILSGDEVSITAKNGYKNYIYDNRDLVDSTDESLYSATIYSLVDLEICGKGELYIESANNNGIHTKDDLQVKNLTLSVKCSDNCLKGNDGVEIENANTTLIATQGDCIKSTNSHINETTLNQKGTIIINGGTHNLYAACDGIDSAYDILIDNETTTLNIYTDRYSEYSEDVTTVSSSIYYLRYSKNTYSFSIKYYNSDTDYKWVNATYDSSVSKNGKTYYFYTFERLTYYSKMAIYMYSSSQVQGQDSSYYACTSYMSLNDSYDTIELSYRQNKLSTSWNDYSSSSLTSSVGNMGGSESGNTDKTEYSTKGLKAANEITINNGVVNITSRDDGIHANNEATLENGETALGNVTINGGDVTVFSCDDGIHADGNLIINNGNVSVTNSYEGLEGTFITISGGNVSIISSDDGMNGQATSGQAIIISGGNVYVYAQGDGIDSNSTSSYNAILFSGGNTVVICNSNGNSAIDSENGYSYIGGSVVALTTSGGMSSEATKCSSFTSVGTSSTISLTSGNYLVVSVNSTTKAVIKMPCSMSASAIYLGSNSAKFTSSSSNSLSLDSNSVYWA